MNKKNILILGSTGMLGYTLTRILSLYNNINVYATMRGDDFYKNYPVHSITNIHAELYHDIQVIMLQNNIDIVINCIGVVKKAIDWTNVSYTAFINGFLPHVLARKCKEYGKKLIHISTDCVFDGKGNGNYTENDYPNASDFYGVSKIVGEIKDDHNLTLRTSIIGPEIKNRQHGLFEWFINSNNDVDGYKNAIYNGLTTLELSSIICFLINNNIDLRGLYHVGSHNISKYELLHLFKKIYDKDININENTTFVSNKTLNYDRFKRDVGYDVPTWERMILNMKNFDEYYGVYK